MFGDFLGYDDYICKRRFRIFLLIKGVLLDGVVLEVVRGCDLKYLRFFVLWV